MNYIQLFFQTFLLEYLFLIIFFFRVKLGKKTLIIFLANGLTHPLLVFGILKIPKAHLITLVLAAEGFAILVECLIYRKWLRVSWTKAIVGALLANLFSWEFGPRLSYILSQFGLVI